MKLDGKELADRHPALTRDVAGTMAEAAAVALARRHAPPTPLALHDGEAHAVDLEWAAPEAGALIAWRDAGRATEWGAEALAALTVDRLRGCVLIERAPRGTRADYYVGRPGEPLEHATLLEVGGIDDGSVRSLLEEKRLQVAGNPALLPGIAAAVRFRDPCVMLQNASPDEP